MIIDYPASNNIPSRTIGREVAATLAAGILLPFGWIKSKPQRRRPKTKSTHIQEQRTVVFVHGYLANKSSFLPLSMYLRAHGITKLLSYEYSGKDGIDRAAIGLRDFLKQNVRSGKIDLVCHSLGGLVARIYMQQLGGARRVESYITLGTPHKGTYNAYWLTSRVGRELRPDSLQMQRLERYASELNRVDHLAIVAGSDNIIIPRVFATAENFLIFPGLGHLGLLFSPAVFRAILNKICVNVNGASN